MEDDRDLDRRLVGWISAGPDSAPREVVERALVETTTIVQLPKERETRSAIWPVVMGTLLALIILFVVVGAAVLLLR